MSLKRFVGKFMFVMALSIFSFQIVVQAQDEITDEDLKEYAVIQNAVDMIRSSISPTVNELIKKQEGMTGQRFQELRKAGTSEAKMKEAGAQDWEIKFMTMINNLMSERGKAAQEVVNLLINNSNMTAAKYNAIKNGLESDNDLKARYEQLTNSDQ